MDYHPGQVHAHPVGLAARDVRWSRLRQLTVQTSRRRAAAEHKLTPWENPTRFSLYELVEHGTQQLRYAHLPAARQLLELGVGSLRNDHLHSRRVRRAAGQRLAARNQVGFSFARQPQRL